MNARRSTRRRDLGVVLFFLLLALWLAQAAKDVTSGDTSAAPTAVASPTTTASAPADEPTPSEEATPVVVEPGVVPPYVREEFGDGWASVDGCDTRNRVLARDLHDVVLVDGSHCLVASGVLTDPYTGTVVHFTRGRTTSSAVQVDHVLPLAEAWRAGAHAWTREQRIAFANDTSNLLATDGKVNAAKSDDSLAEFIDEVDESFRCTYAATYVEVADRYGLTLPEVDATVARDVLVGCA